MSETSRIITLLFIGAVISRITLIQCKLLYQMRRTGGEWNTAIREKHCKSESQPMVEYYDLNDTQYLFFSERMTWDEARVLCSYYNAKLAILDTMEKAVTVAEKIADSNIEMEEDSWLGGRRFGDTWSWTYDHADPQTNIEIPLEPNIENYPPWTRRASRLMKNCLAIDRRSHSRPNFVDLDCRLQRPFICEKRLEDGFARPVPSKLVETKRHTYTFYHARFTWEEAAVYCRLLGARLAILKDRSIIEILAHSMTKARPDFEAVWIGAHYTYGQWVWMSTGTSLESVKGENGYPPWISGRSERNEGCLLLDRHTESTPSFVETTCDRKRDFVCEEYPEDETSSWQYEPIKFAYNNSTYIIYPLEKSWQESSAFCNERGSMLAYVNDINVTNLIVEAMGDHPKDITHLWIGGHLAKPNEWQWTHSGRRIAQRKDSFGFPPWANLSERLDYYTGRASTCLNLDRSDHVRPHLYGLDCDSKQAFVCKITCDVTPPVANGSWTCEDTRDARRCELRCDDGFMVMGVRSMFCTHQDGWSTVKNWLEVPLCLDISRKAKHNFLVSRDYTKRMVRSLDHDLQASAGYYFILDHSAEEIQSLSLGFMKNILNIFPINYNLKMGMFCLTNSPAQLPFNQTDTCAALNVINTLAKNLSAIDGQINSNILRKHLSMHEGKKVVIFTIIDVGHISRYLELLAYMKSIGNQIVVIGLENNWDILLALASIGFDRRKNLYLLNIKEFDTVINELRDFKKGTLHCSSRETNNFDIDSIESTDRELNHKFNLKNKSLSTDEIVDDYQDDKNSPTSMKDHNSKLVKELSDGDNLPDDALDRNTELNKGS